MYNMLYVCNTYRLQLFDHLDTIPLHLPVNLAKFSENFTCSRLQFSNTNRGEDVAEFCQFQ